jgi:hypothetical protein
MTGSTYEQNKDMELRVGPLLMQTIPKPELLREFQLRKGERRKV